MSDYRPFTLATDRGVTLDGAEHGAADGAPILFLHGLTDSWRAFKPLLSRLQGSHRAIAFSHRGHGDSSKPTSGYGIPDLAADAAAALEALGVGRVLVVGHSLGTLAAIRLAASRPELIAGVVLIGPFVTTAGNPTIDELWRDLFATVADPLDPAVVRAWQEGASSPDLDPAFLAEVITESMKSPARVWRAAFEDLLTTDLSDDLGKIAAPTLVIVGELDAMCEADAERVSIAVPGARLVRLPSRAHAPHWEDPATVAQLLADFLDGVGPAAKPAFAPAS
jgi:non-heme chloroperoxidase